MTEVTEPRFYMAAKLVLCQECRLKVFENEVLRRIFGLRKENFNE
jgi:hypothetical protein